VLILQSCNWQNSRVVHLIRTGFGLLELKNLKIGHYRRLEPDEVEAMKKMAGLG